MKHLIFFSLLLSLSCAGYAQTGEPKNIRIATDHTDLVLQVPENGRLYQVYFGEKLRHEADLDLGHYERFAGISCPIGHKTNRFPTCGKH